MRRPNFVANEALWALGVTLVVGGSIACGEATIGTPGSDTSAPSPSTGGSPTAPGVTPPGVGGNGGGGNPTSPPTDCQDPVSAVIEPRAWRLNEAQYRRTVLQLFDGDLPSGLDAVTWPFAGEDNLSGEAFTTLSSGPRVVAASFDRALEAAERVSRVYVQAARDGDGCMREEPIAADCLEDFVVEAAQVLFRRSDVAAALEPQLAELEDSAPDERVALAEELVLSLLMNPRFLFRLELGRPTVSPQELAERISYSLTDAPPDAELLARVEDGTLSEPSVLAAQIDRLVFTPQGLEKATKFIREYLRYDKLFTVDPRANQRDVPSFRPNELVEDTDALVEHLLQTKGRQGFLTALFSTDEIFVQDKTREYYGDIGDVGGEPTLVTSYLGERKGLLTQPSWLVSFSQGHRNDPIERGRFIREQILCEYIPEIAISDVEPVPEDDSIPLAERLRAHTAPTECSQCHVLMDDLGLALEQYDHYGRYRAEEAGQPVQTAGQIVAGGDANGSFANTSDFLGKLADSRTVSTCFAQHAFAFYLGREIRTDEACLAQQAEGVFTEAGQSLPALLSFYFQNSQQR